MYEVGSVMAPYANYLFASELLEPGTGWDYSMLGALVSGVTATGAAVNSVTGHTEKDLAELLIEGYMVRLGMAVCGALAAAFAGVMADKGGRRSASAAG